MLLLNIKSISDQWDALGFFDLMLNATRPVSSQQKTKLPMLSGLFYYKILDTKKQNAI